MRYFVMDSRYTWVEVSRDVYATAGSNKGLIPNTATLNSESFVDVTVKNIGLDSLASLLQLMMNRKST